MATRGKENEMPKHKTGTRKEWLKERLDLLEGEKKHTHAADDLARRRARGVDAMWGMYQWLDRAPKGRNEKGIWFKRHDEYEKR